MKLRLTFSVALLVFVLAMPPIAMAQEVVETPVPADGGLPEEPAPPVEEPAVPLEEPAVPVEEPTPPPSRAVDIRASEVKGYAVRNSAGEDLGSISDLMVFLADGRVPFVAVSFGGFLGIGQNLVPVPQSAVSLIPSEKVAIIDIPADTLRNSPTIDPANWPSTATEGWDLAYVEYWTQAGIQMTQQAVADPLQGRAVAAPAAGQQGGDTLTVLVGASRHSELVTFGLTNRDMENLGRIDDLIFDWEQGMLTHLVVRFSPPAAAPAAPPADTTAGAPVETVPADKVVPIPWTSLILDPLNKKFLLNLSATDLAGAPSLSEDYSDLTGETWNERFSDFWAKLGAS